MFRTSN